MTKVNSSGEGFFNWTINPRNTSYEVEAELGDEPIVNEELIIHSGKKDSDVSIPYDTAFTVKRRLSTEAGLIPNATIEIYENTFDVSDEPTRRGRYVAFLDEPPCDPEFYTNYTCPSDPADARFECFPVEHSVPCDDFDRVYLEEDAEDISGDLESAGMNLASN